MASSTANSVFISRLRGLPVLDAAADQVGRVRDVVVLRRTEGRAPRVKGLVVELFARRRIFIPMERVRSVDPSQVVIGGVVNTRRFERRESETLVIDDLFDLVVQRHDHPGSAVIFDVAMKPVRSREWELSEIALRDQASPMRFGVQRFGRPGHVVIVDWHEVALFTSEQTRTTDQLIAQMEDMKPADVARELHDMSPERRTEVASALDDSKLADALEELPEDEQVQLISELEGFRRGPYGGAVLYSLPDGTMDACIALRTMVIADGVAYLQAGAGVVADSDPAAEHEECLRKLAALEAAIDLAEIEFAP